MIDGQNFFDQPVKNNLRIFDKIWKIAIDQGNDYTNGCFAGVHLFQKILSNDSNRFK